MFPQLDRYHLFFGKGMCSDDTDHACMVAQAVAVAGNNPRRFASSFAWRLRFWLAGGFVRFYARADVIRLFQEAGLPAERLELIDLGRDLVAVARVA